MKTNFKRDEFYVSSSLKNNGSQDRGSNLVKVIFRLKYNLSMGMEEIMVTTKSPRVIGII